jgi:hypothetical protein
MLNNQKNPFMDFIRDDFLANIRSRFTFLMNNVNAKYDRKFFLSTFLYPNYCWLLDEFDEFTAKGGLCCLMISRLKIKYIEEINILMSRKMSSKLLDVEKNIDVEENVEQTPRHRNRHEPNIDVEIFARHRNEAILMSMSIS